MKYSVAVNGRQYLLLEKFIGTNNWNVIGVFKNEQTANRIAEELEKKK